MLVWPAVSRKVCGWVWVSLSLSVPDKSGVVFAYLPLVFPHTHACCRPLRVAAAVWGNGNEEIQRNTVEWSWKSMDSGEEYEVNECDMIQE